MKSNTDRRTLLKGIAGGVVTTVALPWLESLATIAPVSHASANVFPTRFGVFFWGNGVLPDKWFPTTAGANWNLTEQLQPFKELQQDITVLSKYDVKITNTAPHFPGAVGFLTGHKTDGVGTYFGPTIDHVFAQSMGGDTRFRSIVTASAVKYDISYAGAGLPNPAIRSPSELFDRIFNNGFRLAGEEGVADPSLRIRRSVLDIVNDQIQQVKKTISSDDQKRLDQHLTGVRELEKRLAFIENNPANFAACERPNQPTSDFPELDGQTSAPERNRAIVDLLTMALACDQTRVFSHLFSEPLNDFVYEGTSGSHHQLTHDEPGEQPQVNEIVKAMMSEYAYFVQSLKNVQEGDGTLLDNTIVIGATDVSNASIHSIENMPILLAGSAGGKLTQGRHIVGSGGANASDVCLTIGKALGIPLTAYGQEDAKSTSTIGELEA